MTDEELLEGLKQRLSIAQMNARKEGEEWRRLYDAVNAARERLQSAEAVVEGLGIAYNSLLALVGDDTA